MKLLFDRRYPVTSLLLLVTTAVFLSMFIRFGGDYQTGAAIYYSGGIIGEVVKVDPSQLWRIVTATFVHIGLEHFVLNMITLYYLGRLAEDLFGSKAFLALYLLSGMMGNVFVAIFTPDVIAGRSFYSPVWTVWDHWCFALYCPKPLYSALESVLYQLDCGQFDL